MTQASSNLILAPGEGEAVEVINDAGRTRICLACEHASAFIPSSLNGLGLRDADRFSHAAWDIGASALARVMADTLGATLVAARVSRLVYDCNRPPVSPGAMPDRSETIEIPGNRALSDEGRRARIREIYDPFSDALSRTLDRCRKPVVLVTVHSFSPTWFGKERDVQIGLLHDDDDRLATRMLRHADPTLRTLLNAPYSAADGVTHTLKRHAVPRGIENVMIEVRNDLLSDDAGVGRIATVLCKMLRAALADSAGAAA